MYWIMEFTTAEEADESNEMFFNGSDEFHDATENWTSDSSSPKNDLQALENKSGSTTSDYYTHCKVFKR